MRVCPFASICTFHTIFQVCSLFKLSDARVLAYVCAHHLITVCIYLHLWWTISGAMSGHCKYTAEQTILWGPTTSGWGIVIIFKNEIFVVFYGHSVLFSCALTKQRYTKLLKSLRYIKAETKMMIAAKHLCVCVRVRLCMYECNKNKKKMIAKMLNEWRQKM